MHWTAPREVIVTITPAIDTACYLEGSAIGLHASVGLRCCQLKEPPYHDNTKSVIGQFVCPV